MNNALAAGRPGLANQLMQLASAPSGRMPEHEPEPRQVEPAAPQPPEALQRLLSTPMTTDQQREALGSMMPSIVPLFDRFQQLLRKHYPQAPVDQPTNLPYDLDPPDDAPDEIKATAARLRMMLERMQAPSGGPPRR